MFHHNYFLFKTFSKWLAMQPFPKSIEKIFHIFYRIKVVSTFYLKIGTFSEVVKFYSYRNSQALQTSTGLISKWCDLTSVNFVTFIPNGMIYDICMSKFCWLTVFWQENSYAVEVMTSRKLAHTYFPNVAMVLVHAHCAYTHTFSIALSQGLRHNAKVCEPIHG